MNDLELAIQNLGEHSICLCKNGSYITDDAKGIAPIIKLLQSGTDISGYAAADHIVGKAAAMLLKKAGISAVYGMIMSEAARDFLQQSGIPYSYETLTARIVNRSGDDICPMEKTVADISDPEEAYSALLNKLKEMRSKAQ